MPKLSLIVAYAGNRVIGRDNALPWRLPGDLAHFKRATLGHPIIMGRKTWESLGRALPGRVNIVVTRQANYEAPNAVVAGSLQAALDACSSSETPYVIGGAQLYALALPLADRIIATEVHAQVDGDARFPALPTGQWQETDRQPQAEENGYAYDFVVYERVATT